MSMQQIVDDMYALNRHLQSFEKRYGLTSSDFYELYSNGDLDEGEFEQSRDFVEWAGFHKMKSQLEAEFARLSHERLAALRSGEQVLLTPQTA